MAIQSSATEENANTLECACGDATCKQTCVFNDATGLSAVDTSGGGTTAKARLVTTGKRINEVALQDTSGAHTQYISLNKILVPTNSALEIKCMLEALGAVITAKAATL
jgi:hypothetical protein